MGQTAVIPAQIVDVAARSLLGNNTASADAAQTISFSAASSGDVLTVQGDGSVAFAAPSGGIGGSTGSTDNAVLRADGAGGATLQDSGWIIPDIYTSSPNATVNHLSLQATGSSTNVSVSIVPKGSGSFSLHVPDGTTAGGNARGANAVDLQTVRSNSALVASGSGSFIGGGQNNQVTGTNAACPGGTNNAVTGQSAGCIGESNTVNGRAAVALNVSQATANCAFASGMQSLSDRVSQYSHASGTFGGIAGSSQFVRFVLGEKTTTNAAVSLKMSSVSSVDGSGNFSSVNAKLLTIPSGKILHATIHIVGSKSDGAAVASYMRQVTIKNVGGTTSIVGTVNTIGTDEAASTSIAITADNTNDALDIAVTGIASETWRWAATVQGIEIAYGS